MSQRGTGVPLIALADQWQCRSDFFAILNFSSQTVSVYSCRKTTGKSNEASLQQAVNTELNLLFSQKAFRTINGVRYVRGFAAEPLHCLIGCINTAGMGGGNLALTAAPSSLIDLNISRRFWFYHKAQVESSPGEIPSAATFQTERRGAVMTCMKAV